MAAHAKSAKLAATLNWFAAALALIMVFAIGCVGGYQAKDSFGQVPTILVFGGNTDPGDGNGGGLAKDQLVAGGWGSAENIYQVQWKADISQGTATQTDEAMGNGHRAFNDLCGGGCIIAGFSLGTSPALQLASETGTLPENNYIFGGPQPSTGIWHQPYIDNPFIEPFVAGFGDFKTDRPVPAGTQVFYDTQDPYANSAPQCGGPGLFLILDLNHHRIISRSEADASHIWTGSDGAIMHEVGYQAAPFGLPRSGSDESQPWDFCPPEVPDQIPAMNGDPGVPELPGIPSR